VTTNVADLVKDIGFEYAMRSGSTIAVSDITIPEAKVEILAKAQGEVEGVNRAFRRGLLTEQERNERIIEIWQQTTKGCGASESARRWTRPATSRPWPTLARPRAVLAQSHSWLVCAV
jgi:DNA-directed RNA polymerase subunit beta'